MMLRRIWWIYQRVRYLPQEIQAAAVAEHRLNMSIFQTRREILQTQDADKKTELTKKLRDLLGRQFDNDQIVKEYRIKILADQLVKLKKEIEQRKTNRQKVIEERLEKLMNSDFGPRPHGDAPGRNSPPPPPSMPE